MPKFLSRSVRLDDDARQLHRPDYIQLAQLAADLFADLFRILRLVVLHFDLEK